MGQGAKTVVTALFLAANPRETHRLALDREVAEIKTRLAASRLRDRFDLRQEWTVGLQDLARLLMDSRPTIVHFSGHGSPTGELIFEDPTGAAGEMASQQAIADLFRILRDDIRLVFLNACYTTAQASAIAEHIECVIGTSAALDDRKGIAFAGGFYEALGFNRDIGTAFQLGHSAVALVYGDSGAGGPQLIVRPGVDPHRVTLLQEVESETNLQRTKVSLLKEAQLTGAEAGDVTGIAGHSGDAPPAEVDVLKRATIKGGKLGNITGITTGNSTVEKKT